MRIHLEAGEGATLCGERVRWSAAVSEIVREVTCDRCRAIAGRLSPILARERRNPTPTGSDTPAATKSVLEMKAIRSDAEVWHLFNLKTWLRDVPDGEYVVTLRVRRSGR